MREKKGGGRGCVEGVLKVFGGLRLHLGNMDSKSVADWNRWESLLCLGYDEFIMRKKCVKKVILNQFMKTWKALISVNSAFHTLRV